jgi:nicotinamidase-related amidase
VPSGDYLGALLSCGGTSTMRAGMNALLVIDVQEEYFEKPNKPLKNSFIKNVETLIKNAEENDVKILIIEMGKSPTIKNIVKTAKRPKTIKKTKFSAIDALKTHKELVYDEYHLCGLYSDICVHETARDLLKHGHSVVIHNKAVIESDRVLGYHEDLNVCVTSSLKVFN